MNEHSKKQTKRLLVRGAIGLVVTVGLVWVLFRYVDWPEVWGVLRRVGPRHAALGLGIYLLLYLVRGYRFWLLAPRTPFPVMMCITAVHNVLLRLLPMRTGDFSYAILVKRAGTAGLGESLIDVLLLRLLDTTAVVALFAATLALNPGLFRASVPITLAATCGVGTLGLLCVLFFRPLLRLSHAGASRLLRLVRVDRHPRIGAFLTKIDRTVTTYRALPTRTVLGLAACTMAQWILNFVFVFAIMRAFSISVGPAQAVLGGTAAVVTGFLPIGGIGSFGTLEAGWALGFALVGLPANVAVASGFGFSIVTFVYAALFGVIGWFLLGRVGRARSTTP